MGDFDKRKIQQRGERGEGEIYILRSTQQVIFVCPPGRIVCNKQLHKDDSREEKRERELTLTQLDGTP